MMQEICMHVIDIVQNSIAAQAKHIEVELFDCEVEDELGFWVKDDGVGIDPEFIESVLDPFVTSRSTRKVGLGLPLLKMSTTQCEGRMDLSSIPHQETRVYAKWKRSHIDTPPWGDIAECWMICYQSFPNQHLKMTMRLNDKNLVMDNQELWDMLEDSELYYEPSILMYLQTYVRDQLSI
jgi:hypothetical protein